MTLPHIINAIILHCQLAYLDSMESFLLDLEHLEWSDQTSISEARKEDTADRRGDWKERPKYAGSPKRARAQGRSSPNRNITERGKEELLRQNPSSSEPSALWDYGDLLTRKKKRKLHLSLGWSRGEGSERIEKKYWEGNNTSNQNLFPCNSKEFLIYRAGTTSSSWRSCRWHR